MPKRTPQQVAAKWVQRATGAVTSYKQGIADTTVNPMQLAARAATLWLANTTAAKPKFQRNVAAVSKELWQTRAETKGATNYPVGVQHAETKMQAVMTTLLPFITQVKATLPARGNLEANIARMGAFARGMNKYQKPAGA